MNINEPQVKAALIKAQSRFWSKVDVSSMDECWVWLAAKDELGYGKFSFMGKTHLAHRIAYASRFEQLDDQLVIDHLCRNPSCCNISHLQQVTLTENTRRGIGIAVINAAKTHCPQGHPYSGENVSYTTKGWRLCKTCNRANARQHRKGR